LSPPAPLSLSSHYLTVGHLFACSIQQFLKKYKNWISGDSLDKDANLLGCYAMSSGIELVAFLRH
jgi:hypothetical protein